MTALCATCDLRRDECSDWGTDPAECGAYCEKEECRTVTSDEAIPDPGEDFEGCIRALCDQVIAEMDLLLPDDLSPLERERRLIALSGRRYLTYIMVQAPEWLQERERGIFDRAIDRYNLERRRVAVYE